MENDLGERLARCEAHRLAGRCENCGAEVPDASGAVCEWVYCDRCWCSGDRIRIQEKQGEKK